MFLSFETRKGGRDLKERKKTRDEEREMKKKTNLSDHFLNTHCFWIIGSRFKSIDPNAVTIKSGFGSIDTNGRSSSICFGNSSVPFHHNYFGPDLVKNTKNIQKSRSEKEREKREERERKKREEGQERTPGIRRFVSERRRRANNLPHHQFYPIF